jgi:hypothetical protein
MKSKMATIERLYPYSEKTHKILEEFWEGKELGCGCGLLWNLDMIYNNHKHDENGHYWMCACGYIITRNSESNSNLALVFEEYYLERLKYDEIAKLRKQHRVLDCFIGGKD